MGTARAIARAYSASARRAAELGIIPETFAKLAAIHDTEHPKDAVIGLPSCMALGFTRPGPSVAWGGFASVMNNMNCYFFDGPREKALRDAVHLGIRRLSG